MSVAKLTWRGQTATLRSPERDMRLHGRGILDGVWMPGALSWADQHAAASGARPDFIADFAQRSYAVGLPSLPAQFADLLDFTRSGTATWWGANGLLQTAAADAPRFDFDPATGACRGVLIEASRTNSLAASEDFTGWAAHNPDNSTRSGAIALAGATTKGFGDWSDYTAAGSPGAARAYSPSIAVTGGVEYVVSIFLDSAASVTAGASKIEFYFGEPGDIRARVRFEPATGVIVSGTATATGGDPVLHDYGREDIGGGVWRLWMRASPAADDSFVIGLWESGPSTAGDLIRVTGGQIEESTGANDQPRAPTSYIPTSGAPVTRAADTLALSVAAMGWFSHAQGTLLVEGEMVTGAGGGSTEAFAHLDGNGVIAGLRGGGWQSRDGTNDANWKAGYAGGLTRMAVRWGAAQMAASIDGNPVQTGAYDGQWGTLSALNLGRNSAPAVRLRRVLGWAGDLADADLQGLSA